MAPPTAPRPGASRPGAVDWRTVLMLLPQRRFTAAELARAVPEPMSRSVKLSVALNLTLPTAVLVLAFGRDNP